MDQMSFFEHTEESIYQEILPSLQDVLDKNWADRSLLSLEERQNYFSIMFDGSVVARLNFGKNAFVEFPDIGIMLPEGKKRDKYIHVKLQNPNETRNYVTYMIAVIQKIIESIPKEYSCCSRYMECSDKRACTNPDKDMAMRCGYRKVLMSGKVFFGANRNID